MPETPIQQFIDRWKGTDGSEQANSQPFLLGLCAAYDLPTPDPAAKDAADNAYCFERQVTFNNPDGTDNIGRIDLYRRDCFILEAKRTRKAFLSQAWDAAMIKAHGQAQRYARALPAGEGRPPFLLILDVGRAIEIYSEFSRSGGAYVPFPDPRSHVIALDDLADEKVRERLRAVWLDPLSLDPSLHSARVTKAIATDLAKLAASLEAQDYDADSVAAFLMRCLFTMFAEDIGLLPERSFSSLLTESLDDPTLFQHMVPGLWRSMNTGSFSPEIKTQVLRFNGGLFADQQVLPLDKQQLTLLSYTAQQDWREVEPAIFGTLLERALDPDERHKLGAHYTPRAYVERLVMPTIIEPLREDWESVQAAAFDLDQQGKRNEAIAALRGFHLDLCKLRVLDPACGSGNFLYVTLEHLKRLEGEIFNALDDLGDTQERLEETGVTVDPPEPVLKDFHNIEHRDAVLAWEKIEFVTDEKGIPVTHWDGKTMKRHPVTGKEVPDESAQVAVERYIEPHKAKWPEADFVVGNPPFIGGWRLRQVLGDGYVEALWSVYPQMPQKTDYVMYWWLRAAESLRSSKLKRFGLITTNSVRQLFQRRVIGEQLRAKKPISIIYAVPDHPWVDSSDGAAVRIAMTVAQAGDATGTLARVVAEHVGGGEGLEIDLSIQKGKVHEDVRIGPNLAAAVMLQANLAILSPGVQLYGSGFILDADEASELIDKAPSGLATKVIRPYINGRDFISSSRKCSVIDFYGLDVGEARELFPDAYQRVLDRVKPERDQNRRESIRDKWWRFGWERPRLRDMCADLQQFVATPETAKHKVFRFVEVNILPDNMLTVIALAVPCVLGVLSSRVHVAWALSVGGTLEDRPRYNTRCFETFPFPESTD